MGNFDVPSHLSKLSLLLKKLKIPNKNTITKWLKVSSTIGPDKEILFAQNFNYFLTH